MDGEHFKREVLKYYTELCVSPLFEFIRTTIVSHVGLLFWITGNISGGGIPYDTFVLFSRHNFTTSWFHANEAVYNKL